MKSVACVISRPSVGALHNILLRGLVFLFLAGPEGYSSLRERSGQKVLDGDP